MKLPPVNRTETLEKVEPTKTALALAEDLISMWKQIKDKERGMENR